MYAQENSYLVNFFDLQFSLINLNLLLQYCTKFLTDCALGRIFGTPCNYQIKLIEAFIHSKEQFFILVSTISISTLNADQGQTDLVYLWMCPGISLPCLFRNFHILYFYIFNNEQLIYMCVNQVFVLNNDTNILSVLPSMNKKSVPHLVRDDWRIWQCGVRYRLI